MSDRKQPFSTIVSTSVGPDIRRTGVSGSPYDGDTGNLGLFVPVQPTNDLILGCRYLFRLSAVMVPDGSCAHVKSVRWMATIAANVLARGYELVADVISGPSVLIEKMIRTPFWSFPDGNVSFHLTFTKPTTTPPGGWMPPDPVAPFTIPILPGQSPDWSGVDPGMMAGSNLGPAPYTTFNRGIPPGDPVGGLGVCYDPGRCPWDAQLSYLEHLSVIGPGVLALWASVKQTDPTTRLQPAAGPGPETISLGCEPEDIFWLSYPDTARYHRVAGEITVEFEDDCPHQEQKKCCTKPKKNTVCCNKCQRELPEQFDSENDVENEPK